MTVTNRSKQHMACNHVWGRPASCGHHGMQHLAGASSRVAVTCQVTRPAGANTATTAAHTCLLSPPSSSFTPAPPPCADIKPCPGDEDDLDALLAKFALADKQQKEVVVVPDADPPSARVNATFVPYITPVSRRWLPPHHSSPVPCPRSSMVCCSVGTSDAYQLQLCS